MSEERKKRKGTEEVNNCECWCSLTSGIVDEKKKR